MQINIEEKKTIALGVAGLLLFFIVFFQTIQTNEYYLTDHLLVHTLLELSSIVISLSIFIYGWLTFPLVKSRFLIVVSLTFLTVGIFDILHTLSYTGMPFSVAANNQTTVWFWIIARLTVALVLVLVVFLLSLESKITTKYERNSWLVVFGAYVVLLSFFIIANIAAFPLLLLETGPTVLKTGLEYFIAFLHLVAIVIMWEKYNGSRDPFYLNLITASYFLILSGLIVTISETVHDLTFVVGHLFKLTGFFFIMKAFYYFTIQVPLLNKKQAEDKLVDIESELELLFKNTEDAIFIYNLRDKSILRRNAAFTKMFGYDSTKPLSANCLIPFDRREEFSKIVRQLEQGHSIVNFKTVRQRQDKSLIDVSMTVSPMISKDEIVICAAIFRDISEQTKAEEELRQTKKELQEIIEQYQGLIFKFKKVQDTFVYTLMDGKLLYEEGMSPENVIGKPVKETYIGNDGGLSDVNNERAWQGEEVEFQFEDSKGSIFLASLKPIHANGKVIEVLGTVVDITKLIKTEELLRRTEKLSVVGELAAGFAHEIRNPLTTVKGFLQLIGLEAKEKNQEYITIMLNEIDRLEMITNEFMVVAKPQVTKYEMEDLQIMTESVIKFLQPQALLNNIEMKTVIHEPLAEVYCDKHQLRQVLINIYKNAMEAMPSGGVITTELAIYKNDISIAITDEGVGIPDELIPKLGEPFYSLKEKGTGLGLMVSKKIIESHEGELLINSKPNIGTTMTIVIPIKSEKELCQT
jgi:PAS domain S-box-containing protein